MRRPYRWTTRSRREQAEIYADLIREAFDYEGPISICAEVEGYPNPDTDDWQVKAEVKPEWCIMFSLGPLGPEQQITGKVFAGKPHGVTYTSFLKWELVDLEMAKGWISIAWMLLYPDDPEVVAIQEQTIRQF